MTKIGFWHLTFSKLINLRRNWIEPKRDKEDRYPNQGHQKGSPGIKGIR